MANQIYHHHTKYQRDALNIIYSSNILLYMFRVSSTHLQKEQLYVSSIWYRHSVKGEWSNITKT